MVSEIVDHNFKTMRNWSVRNKRSGSHKKLIYNVRHILRQISGNNILAMITNILTAKEKCLLHVKHTRALQNYGQVYNSTPQKQRHKYLYPLRKAGISIQEARSLGFHATFHMWKSCTRTNERKKGGCPTIPISIREDIDSHMESLSNVAANRYLKRSETNAWYRTISLSEAYDSFQRNDEISFTSFLKYIPGKFKKPHRLSDLCEYCEYNRELKIDIFDAAVSLNFHSISDINEPNYAMFLNYLKTKNQNNKIVSNSIEKIEKSMLLDEHKKITTRQRLAYNQMKNDVELLANSILIEIDFKQKIHLGAGPRNVSGDFYVEQQRSFIGFGVYYKDEANKLQCLNMDVVFNHNRNQCIQALSAFRLIRKQNVFKKVEKTKYLIWTDCGKHFR